MGVANTFIQCEVDSAFKTHRVGVSVSWLSLCCVTYNHPNLNSLKQLKTTHIYFFLILYIRCRLAVGSGLIKLVDIILRVESIILLCFQKILEKHGVTMMRNFPNMEREFRCWATKIHEDKCPLETVLCVFSIYCHAQSSSVAIGNIVMTECLLNKRM